jgi:hypothetical protein
LTCQEKEDIDFSDRKDSQKSIIFNLKSQKFFFDHQHNTPLTKIEIEEITMYLSIAQ